MLERPRTAAPQATQLLYGHCAEVIATEGPWLQVRGADGYEGWVHEGYTAPREDDEGTGWGWDVEGELSIPNDEQLPEAVGEEELAGEGGGGLELEEVEE